MEERNINEIRGIASLFDVVLTTHNGRLDQTRKDLSVSNIWHCGHREQDIAPNTSIEGYVILDELDHVVYLERFLCTPMVVQDEDTFNLRLGNLIFDGHRLEELLMNPESREELLMNPENRDVNWKREGF